MLAEELGYQQLSDGLRENMGFLDLVDADPRSARRLFVEVLGTARITGVRTYVRGALLGLALAVGADGDPTIAATLHGAADELYEQAGLAFEAIEAGLRDRDHASLRTALGDAEFEVAYARGRALSQADIVAVALALAAADAEPDPGVATVSDAVSDAVSAAGQAAADPSAGPLSEREREILALLASGATDAQIAERLFLSVNTVRSHLDRIRDKTGARRRPELVRYAVQAGIEAIAPPS